MGRDRRAGSGCQRHRLAFCSAQAAPLNGVRSWRLLTRAWQSRKLPRALSGQLPPWAPAQELTALAIYAIIPEALVLVQRHQEECHPTG